MKIFAEQIKVNHNIGVIWKLVEESLQFSDSAQDSSSRSPFERKETQDCIIHLIAKTYECADFLKGINSHEGK